MSGLINSKILDFQSFHSAVGTVLDERCLEHTCGRQKYRMLCCFICFSVMYFPTQTIALEEAAF